MRCLTARFWAFRRIEAKPGEKTPGTKSAYQGSSNRFEKPELRF